MINVSHIRDINSIGIQEDSEGRISFVFKSEDDYINIDCGIPASLGLIIYSDVEKEDSLLISELSKEMWKYHD